MPATFCYSRIGGIYYVPVRDTNVLSPRTFNAILIDKRAANSVRPVNVDDAVVFVEGSGETIAAARLDGNIYLKWSVAPISNFHSHLIKTPKKLCAPPIYSNSPERYLFVINSDGTIASVSWIDDFGTENIGFVPWVTEGAFAHVAPIFGGYWAIVDRFVSGVETRMLEEFDPLAMLDCTVEYDGVAVPELAGNFAHVWNGGYYQGVTTILYDGTLYDLTDVDVGSQIGFNFTSRVSPWPVEAIDSPRAGMLKARLIRVSVSVMSTTTFQCRTNRYAHHRRLRRR